MNPNSSLPPLHGYKIVDLTRVLAGPLCTQLLGDYGADVIKIEPPTGDQSRTSGPPFHDESSAMYYGLNRNKRSAVLDLKHADQRQMLKSLLSDATALIHNFKPGTMEKWGLSYEHLKHEFPKLIVASISGFGSDGPLGGTPGYDGSAGAWTGVIASNGDACGPMRIGLSVVDVSAGLHTAIGILLAIKAMERDGHGQHLDMSLYDCGLALLHPHGSNWLHGNKGTPRSGNQHPTFTPMGIYETIDKPIYLAISTDVNFRKFCQIMGLAGVLQDEKFANASGRLANRPELMGIVTEALKKVHAAEVVGKLNQADIPAGVVLNVDEALEHPHAIHREMNVELEGQRFVGLPVKLSRTPGGVFRVPPEKNQHFDEIFPGQPMTSTEQMFHSGEFVTARRNGAVVTVLFGREARRNALNSSMLADLDRIVRLLREDTEVSAVIFSGGAKFFSAGADTTDAQLFDKSSTVKYRRGLLARAEICRQIVALPQITIAAIEGFAIGGGLSIALACDFRVMSEEAYLWVPELDRGSIYAWNSIPRLVSLAGVAATRRILYLGEKVEAATGLKWGLVDFVAPAGAANVEAQVLAEKMARKPRLALEICKRNVNQVDALLTTMMGFADADQTALCQQESV